MSVSVETPKRASHFYFLRDKFEQEIARSISLFGEKTKLRDACEYALTNGGKRFRPLIVYLVAEALGAGYDVSESALAVEFFHTASLIVDDLPCMDNDDERREKPSLHKVYGETIALLASYALITEAFGRIGKNGEIVRKMGASFHHLSDRMIAIALESASHCSGIFGATGGQFYDMFPPIPTLENLRQVIYKKTVTLFEVSFVLGWVFGGGDLSKVSLLKSAAYHFGMAFQIADDLSDLEQDLKMERDINLAKFIGKERATAVFREEMDAFERNLILLNIHTPSFQKMEQILKDMIR